MATPMFIFMATPFPCSVFSLVFSVPLQGKERRIGIGLGQKEKFEKGIEKDLLLVSNGKQVRVNYPPNQVSKADPLCTCHKPTTSQQKISHISRMWMSYITHVLCFLPHCLSPRIHYIQPWAKNPWVL